MTKRSRFRYFKTSPEIIRLVEQSHLSVRRTLAKIGFPPTTFYRPLSRFEVKPLPVASFWGISIALPGNGQGMRACPGKGATERWHQTLKNRVLLEN